MIENEMDKVERFILAMLGAEGGSMYTNELIRMGELQGFNRHTIEAVRRRIPNLTTKRIGYGKDGQWAIFLNNDIKGL